MQDTDRFVSPGRRAIAVEANLGFASGRISLRGPWMAPQAYI